MGKRKAVKNCANKNEGVDKWKGFLLSCLFDVEKEKPKLFLKVCLWIFRNCDENINSSQNDWECMFCLLYSHIYKQERDKLKIYRFGVFDCYYKEEIILNEIDKENLNSELRLLKQKCVRAVRAVQVIISNVFRTVETIPSQFKAVLDEEDIIFRLKDMILKHEFSASMNNLRVVVEKHKTNKINLLMFDKQFSSVKEYKSFVAQQLIEEQKPRISKRKRIEVTDSSPKRQERYAMIESTINDVWSEQQAKGEMRPMVEKVSALVTEAPSSLDMSDISDSDTVDSEPEVVVVIPVAGEVVAATPKVGCSIIASLLAVKAKMLSRIAAERHQIYPQFCSPVLSDEQEAGSNVLLSDEKEKDHVEGEEVMEGLQMMDSNDGDDFDDVGFDLNDGQDFDENDDFEEKEDSEDVESAGSTSEEKEESEDVGSVGMLSDEEDNALLSDEEELTLRRSTRTKTVVQVTPGTPEKPDIASPSKGKRSHKNIVSPAPMKTPLQLDEKQLQTQANKAFNSATKERLVFIDGGDRNQSVRVPTGFKLFKTNGGCYRRVLSNSKVTKEEWASARPFIFPDAKWKVSAYVNGIPGRYSCHEICMGFERYGFVSISMIECFGCSPSHAEKCIIDALCAQIESEREDLETTDPDKIPGFKIIGSSEETVFNIKYTKFDNRRRAKHRNFSEYDPSAQYHNGTLDLAKCAGLIDPGVEMINSKGNWGEDTLIKLAETGEQEKHTDGKVDPNRPVIRSYAEIFSDKTKYESYDTAKDGAISIFTHPFGRADCLKCPCGKIVPLPIYSTTFVAAFLAHFGSGNYTQKSVMKKFGYGDVPKFLRAGAVEQFKVFYYIQHEVVIRRMVEPYHEVYHEPQQFYNCVMCGNKDYYTAPYCTSCLLQHKNILLSCEGSKNKFSMNLIYVGTKPFLDIQICLLQIDAEIMTEEAYHARFKETFRSFGMVGAIKLPLQTWEEEALRITRLQYYLVYLEKHSLVAALETSMDPDVYNLELTHFTSAGKAGGPYLRITRSILPCVNVTDKQGVHFGTKLVLRAESKTLYKNIEIEPDIKKWDAAQAICSLREGRKVQAKPMRKDQLDFDDE